MEWLEGIHFFFFSSSGSSTPNNWVYHYQSLISGILALAAAFATILFLHLQHRSDRIRQHESLRSVLALAASEMHRYTESCFHVLRELFSFVDDEKEVAFSPGFRMELPEDSVQKFQQAIQTSDQETSDFLANFLNFCQVQNSRINSLVADHNSENGIHRIDFREQLFPHVLDAYLLRISNNQMYAYGRKRSHSVSGSQTMQNIGTDEWHLERNFDGEVLEYVRSNINRASERIFPARPSIMTRISRPFQRRSH